MCERDRRLGRRTRSGERRVRVAVDEHEVRLLTTHDLGDAGLHDVRIGSPRVEPVPRLVKPELLDEHVRQLPVVVLPRVDDDLVDAGDQEGEGERPALDELRAVPDDGEDLHSDGRLLARVGGPVACGVRLSGAGRRRPAAAVLVPRLSRLRRPACSVKLGA